MEGSTVTGVSPYSPAYKQLKPRYQARARRNALIGMGVIGALIGRSAWLARSALRTQAKMPGMHRRILRTESLIDLTRKQLQSSRLGMSAHLGPEPMADLKALHSKLSGRLHRLKDAKRIREGVYEHTRATRKKQTQGAKRWRNAAIWATPVAGLATGYPLAQYGGMETHAQYETPIMVKQALIKDTGLRHPQPIVRRRR